MFFEVVKSHKWAVGKFDYLKKMKSWMAKRFSNTKGGRQTLGHARSLSGARPPWNDGRG